MRLFAALDIPDEIRARIQRFVEGVSGFAPEARWITPESLHITLKFIGEQPESILDTIREALSPIQSRAVEVSLRGCGFFPGPKLPRIFWIGVIAGPELTSLAAAVEKALIPLGVPPESHAFNPHITLARASGGRKKQRHTESDQGFTHLQAKLAGLPPPEFGSMTAREFFLYESSPSSSGGPQYFKLSGFALA